MQNMRILLTLLILCSAIFTSCVAPQKIIVEFPVHPETRGEFINELNAILVDTRAFEGCKTATVWTNELEDDKVWIYETWQTREHQQAYVNWRNETGNSSHLGPFITGEVRFLWLNQHQSTLSHAGGR
jgi:quinol monooxygenase YgiN